MKRRHFLALGAAAAVAPVLPAMGASPFEIAAEQGVAMRGPLYLVGERGAEYLFPKTYALALDIHAQGELMRAGPVTVMAGERIAIGDVVTIMGNVAMRAREE